MNRFIPPFDLGQFTPSAPALASWLYQIWTYLQNNPIPSGAEVSEQISTAISETVPEAVADYIAEHPVDVPVLSVNDMVGAVVIAYNNLVNENSTLPIYRASDTEITTNDLLAAWSEGCRFVLVNDTTPYMMVKNEDQGAQSIDLIPLYGGGGSGSGDVTSVNGKTGAVLLNYTDFVGSTSTIPVLRAANDEIGDNDLLTAWNRGYRFVVVDNVDPYIILRNGNTVSLLSIRAWRNTVDSVNGKTGAVVLNYTDFVADSSTLPVLHSATMPDQNELMSAWSAGYRFVLVNDVSDGIVALYTLSKSAGAVTAIPTSGGGGSGIRLTTLWSGDPAISAFSAKTVQLSDDSSNYDWLILKYRWWGANQLYQGVFQFSNLITLPGDAGCMSINTGTENNRVGRRGFRINGTSATFDSGSYNSGTHNEYCVPVSIVGVKF